jgi:DNA modification methylase
VSWLNQIHVGDCRALMRDMVAAGVQVQTCVTSPPYFGLRDYGHEGQIGLEASPEEYVAELVTVFREVRQLLRDDGTVWLNLGDSYAGSGRGGYPGGKSGLDGTHEGQDSSRSAREKITGGTAREAAVTQRGSRLPAGYHEKARLAGTIGRAWCPPPVGFKQKDLIGIPWRVAFALQADGWYLRQDIIWHKPNPMPESVQDRCTKAHEYVFLLAKSDRYYFDAGAISEPATAASVDRWAQDVEGQRGSERVPGKTNGTMKAVGGGRSKRNSFARETKATTGDHGQKPQHRPGRDVVDYSTRRNKRSVWTVTTKPYKGAHFATFPRDLIEPCVLAGAPHAGVVLDPFMGSGTTAEVAQQLGRQFIGCELNPEYAAMFREHRSQQVGMAV